MVTKNKETGDSERRAQLSEDNFSQLKVVHLDTLNELKDIQLFSRFIFEKETQRLAKKHGENDLKIQRIRNNLTLNENLLQDIEVELEIAKIKVPEISEGGALVHGRVVDRSNRGITGLTVHLENENRKSLRFMGRSETDASGYYAFPIDPTALAKLSKAAAEGAFLTIATRTGRGIHREFTPLKVAEGDRKFVEVALKREDLSPVRGGKKAREKKTETGAEEEYETTSSPDMWVVKGQVVDENKQSLARLTVSLYDKDLLFDDRLGTAVTDEDGHFMFSYRADDFRDLIEAKPDIYVKVIDKEGKTLYSSRKSVKCEGGRVEVFNIKVKGKVKDEVSDK
ncbi:MAG: hypothetical protein BBJ57_10235 [Desulfobacterales bacterium PC51MH44]|nr:MAG: hypothetical protein BBJ57_10235 [Desulfobacterales bacterium PC51MH44]